MDIEEETAVLLQNFINRNNKLLHEEKILKKLVSIFEDNENAIAEKLVTMEKKTKTMLADLELITVLHDGIKTCIKEECDNLETLQAENKIFSKKVKHLRNTLTQLDFYILEDDKNIICKKKLKCKLIKRSSKTFLDMYSPKNIYRGFTANLEENQINTFEFNSNELENEEKIWELLLESSEYRNEWKEIFQDEKMYLEK